MNTKVSDRQIEDAAVEVFDLLRIFDSPRDAVSVLALANIWLIQQAFAPEDRHKAIQSIDVYADVIKGAISKGWQ